MASSRRVPRWTQARMIWSESSASSSSPSGRAAAGHLDRRALQDTARAGSVREDRGTTRCGRRCSGRCRSPSLCRWCRSSPGASQRRLQSKVPPERWISRRRRPKTKSASRHQHDYQPAHSQSEDHRHRPPRLLGNGKEKSTRIASAATRSGIAPVLAAAESRLVWRAVFSAPPPHAVGRPRDARRRHRPPTSRARAPAPRAGHRSRPTARRSRPAATACCPRTR